MKIVASSIPKRKKGQKKIIKNKKRRKKGRKKNNKYSRGMSFQVLGIVPFKLFAPKPLFWENC